MKRWRGDRRTNAPPLTRGVLLVVAGTGGDAVGVVLSRSVVEYAARSGQAWHLGRQSQFWDLLDYNVPTGEIYQDQMWNEARTLYM